MAYKENMDLMACSKFDENLLLDYATDPSLLSPFMRKQIASHLETCQACKQLVTDMQAYLYAPIFEVDSPRKRPGLILSLASKTGNIVQKPLFIVSAAAVIGFLLMFAFGVFSPSESRQTMVQEQTISPIPSFSDATYLESMQLIRDRYKELPFDLLGDSNQVPDPLAEREVDPSTHDVGFSDPEEKEEKSAPDTLEEKVSIESFVQGDPLFRKLWRYIYASQQQYVKASPGPFSHQSFTEEDLQRMRQQAVLEKLTYELSSNPDFQELISEISKLSQEKWEMMRQAASLIYSPTREEQGKISSELQTQYGQEAQKMITNSIVRLIDEKREFY